MVIAIAKQIVASQVCKLSLQRTRPANKTKDLTSTATAGGITSSGVSPSKARTAPNLEFDYKAAGVAGTLLLLPSHLEFIGVAPFCTEACGLSGARTVCPCFSSKPSGILATVDASNWESP